MKTLNVPKPLILIIALLSPILMAGTKAEHPATDSPLPYSHYIDVIPAVENANRVLVPAEKFYEDIQLQQYDISMKVFTLALTGFDRMVQKGLLNQDSILSIADFSKSSGQKRLLVIDLKNKQVLFHTLVAHGRGSGKEYARSFSNRTGSHKSSLGFYVTSDTYMGSNGYSLKLLGCERGFNDKAYNRAIVMHGADYAEEDYIDSRGLLGRSYGCPAIPIKEHKEIINSIKNGSCLFLYYPDKKYLRSSKLLNG